MQSTDDEHSQARAAGAADLLRLAHAKLLARYSSRVSAQGDLDTRKWSRHVLRSTHGRKKKWI